MIRILLMCQVFLIWKFLNYQIHLVPGISDRNPLVCIQNMLYTITTNSKPSIFVVCIQKKTINWIRFFCSIVLKKWNFILYIKRLYPKYYGVLSLLKIISLFRNRPRCNFVKRQCSMVARGRLKPDFCISVTDLDKLSVNSGDIIVTS